MDFQDPIHQTSLDLNSQSTYLFESNDRSDFQVGLSNQCSRSTDCYTDSIDASSLKFELLQHLYNVEPFCPQPEMPAIQQEPVYEDAKLEGGEFRFEELMKKFENFAPEKVTKKIRKQKLKKSETDFQVKQESPYSCSAVSEFYGNFNKKQEETEEVYAGDFQQENQHNGNQNQKILINLTKSQGSMEKYKSQHRQSKYHNFTKLYFNSLLSVFTQENFQKFQNMTPELLKQLLDIIEKIKESGRYKVSNNKKAEKSIKFRTDLYTNSHYQLLFLQLNNVNLGYMTEQSLDLHRSVFGLKKEDECSLEEFQNQIETMNFFKQVFYEIFQLIEIEDQEYVPVFKLEYWNIICQGAKQMNNKQVVKRFRI